MKYTYYPGCSLNSTAEAYNESIKLLFNELNIELVELADWNCCGATSAHSTNKFLSYALPLRNLIKAQKQGLDIIVPCAACYNVLKKTDMEIRAGNKEAEKINKEMLSLFNEKYSGMLNVRHLLEVLKEEEFLTKILNKLKRPLKGLKVAVYYGCLLTRPYEVSFESNPEQPLIMDEIITSLGAESVRWTHKTECCGASLAISKTEIVRELAQKIIQAAKHAGAHVIVTACPLCHSNLDMRQPTSLKEQAVPILYITEVIGLAAGMDTREWFQKHLVNPQNVLKHLNLMSAS